MRKGWATREQHAFGREAEHVWREVAAKVGSPYTTRGHLRHVHELAIQSTRWATEFQILAAIRQNLTADSSPVRIPEWVRIWAGTEREAEHLRQKAADRKTPLDPAVAAAIGLRPKRPSPNDHAFADDGTGTSTCRLCEGPPGVHVKALAERMEALRVAGRSRPDRVECPECESRAIPGHQCPGCGTFLTTGPEDDERHAVAAAQRITRQANTERPMRRLIE
jgi:hypothetical protein